MLVEKIEGELVGPRVVLEKEFNCGSNVLKNPININEDQVLVIDFSDNVLLIEKEELIKWKLSQRFKVDSYSSKVFEKKMKLMMDLVGVDANSLSLLKSHFNK